MSSEQVGAFTGVNWSFDVAVAIGWVCNAMLTINYYLRVKLAIIAIESQSLKKFFFATKNHYEVLGQNSCRRSSTNIYFFFFLKEHHSLRLGDSDYEQRIGCRNMFIFRCTVLVFARREQANKYEYEPFNSMCSPYYHIPCQKSFL